MPFGGRTHSPWMRDAPEERNPLRADRSADVCVVGAGIAGLTTAYLLVRDGRSVIVLDMLRIGGQESARTTAHLTDVLDEGLAELERLHGWEDASRAVAGHRAAVDRIEEIVRAEEIDCDFERLDGYLFDAPGGEDRIERDLEAARRLGFPDAERIADLSEFGLAGRSGIRFRAQAQFHPQRYLSAIARAIDREGGDLFAGTRVTEIQAISDGVRVTTADGARIEAGAAVVATNTPFTTRVSMHAKQAPYRTYVVGARVPRGTLPRVLLWDTADPYHYVRLHPDPEDDGADVLIVGGEDHKTGQDADPGRRFERLEAWARGIAPGIEAFDWRWSGQVYEPADGLGFLGRCPGEEHVWTVTGDSGQGMTHGTLGAMIVSDGILGRDNPWSELFDPDRSTLKAVGALLQENFDAATQYAEYVTPGDASDPMEVAPGSGAVIRRGLRKVAVYRSAMGKDHELSAVCPHLGCIVAWNPVEGTWDCPCHGSRFAADGDLIHGPAVSGLDPVDPDDGVEVRSGSEERRGEH